MLEGYTESERRRAENRILRDMDRIELVRGGQGRDAEDVRQGGKIGGWLLLIALGLGVLWLLGGCGTVRGFGNDLSEWSDGIRNGVQRDAD